MGGSDLEVSTMPAIVAMAGYSRNLAGMLPDLDRRKHVSLDIIHVLVDFNH